MVDLGIVWQYTMDIVSNKEQTMFYPAEMTREEIEQFEYEINKLIDIERGEGQFWTVNAELQIVAEELREQQEELV